MSMTKKFVVIALVIAATVCGVFYFIRSSSQPSQVAGAKPSELRGKFKTFNGGPVILPKGESYSNEELLALVGEIARRRKENKELTKATADHVVESGDTIVTEGYETEPGVFVFSTLKLTVTGNASAPMVTLHLRRGKFNVSGGYEPLVEDEHEIASGRGYGANNDRYRMYFKATVLPDGRQIKVSMKESEYERSRIMQSGPN
jgi:hypothetical protein